MVDTVRLFSPEYSLRPGNRFKRKVEYSEDTGEVLSETRYCNSEHFSADIQGGCLSLSTSLPKLLFKTNLRELGNSDFPLAVSRVESELDKCGVSVAHNNLSDFSLSRVDFCANLHVENHCMDYLVELAKFGMSRRDKRDIAHETVSFRNSDRELVFYNKVREILETVKDREVLALVEGRPDNILRVEGKLKRVRVIRKFVGAKEAKLENVFDLSLSRGHLLHELEKLVQNSEESQGEFDFHDNLQLLDRVMSQRRRGGFKEFLAVRGVGTFLSDFGYDWRKIAEFLRYRYSARRTYEILRTLKDYQKLLLEKPGRDLLGELKNKLRLVA